MVKTFGDLFSRNSCYCCLVIFDICKGRSVIRSNIPLIIYDKEIFDAKKLSLDQKSVLTKCKNKPYTLSIDHDYFKQNLQDFPVSKTFFIPPESPHIVKIKKIISSQTTKSKKKNRKTNNCMVFRQTKTGQDAVKQFDSVDTIATLPDKKIHCLNVNLGNGKLGFDGQWNHGNNK